MLIQNVIIVGTDYKKFVEKAKEITDGLFVVWYEKLYFNEKTKFCKCRMETQAIILKRIRSRNDIVRWFKLSRFGIISERRHGVMYPIYPKMIFNCPPNLFRLLPHNIKAQCKIYEL
jgi:hypothetical protein